MSRIVHLFIFTAICGLAISYSNLYLFHIVMGIMVFTLLAAGAKYKRLPIKMMPTKFHHFFVFMLSYFTLTLVWTISIPSTATYLFYIMCGSFLAATVILYGDTEKSLTSVFKISAVAFLLEMFISILEIYTPVRLPISPFSTYLNYFGRGITDSLVLPSRVNVDAIPTGFRWNPNNLATTMGIILPFFMFHKNRKVKWLGVISIILIINATQSRANLLAVLVMFLVSLLLYNKRKLFYVAPLLLVLYFLTPQLVSYLQHNFYNSAFGASVTNSVAAFSNVLTGENETGNSLDIRMTLIRDGLDALKSSNGLGIGGGASRVIHNSIGGFMPMHNFWIETLVEGGVIFFVCFAIWYATITMRLLRISYRTKDQALAYYSSASCVAMIGFIPGAISPSSTIYLLPMWLMFGFAIATINSYHKAIEYHEEIEIGQPNVA